MRADGTQGHDFVELGRSSATNPTSFNRKAAVLNGTNPLRRDVVMLPPSGWIVIAFQTNNPGPWIMHCRSFPSLSFLLTGRQDRRAG